MSDPQTTKLGPAAQKIADGLNDAIDGRYHTTDPNALIDYVAAAIWRDRYPDETWEHARWLATETADGGNGRYMTIMGHARAAVGAMIRWSVQHGE